MDRRIARQFPKRIGWWLLGSVLAGTLNPDGISTFHLVGNRDNPPPIHTLVYDFDIPADGNLGSTNLENFFDEMMSGAVPPVVFPGPIISVPIEYEGSPAAGDSGGPMFQRLTASSPWILVGITSSGSDSLSRFGNVAYDTRLNVPDNLRFASEPPVLLLLGLGACICARLLTSAANGIEARDGVR